MVKRPRISRDGLTLAAMLSMMIDHGAIAFMDPASGPYLMARMAGRFAYPVFAVLFLEGRRRSSSGPEKRLPGMLLAACIAEPFYDCMLLGGFGIDMGEQNVMWSWAAALAFLWIAGDARRDTPVRSLWRIVPAFIGFCAVCALGHTDYGLAHAVAIGAGWAAMSIRDGRDGFRTACVMVFGTLLLAYPPVYAIGYAPAAACLWLYDPEEPGERFLPARAGAWFYPLHLAAYAGVLFLSGA